VDIGAELFALTAICSRMEQLIRENEDPDECTHTLELVDYFCHAARGRINQKFQGIHHNDDRSGYHCAQQIMARPPGHLTTGTVRSHAVENQRKT
jgi:hypothetical protein